MKAPVSVPRLLGDSNDAGLRALLQHAQALLRLEKAVLRLLETSLRNHCRVANLRNGVLLLLTDSPVWATRLRYQLPALLGDLQRTTDYTSIQRIELKVSLTPARVESRTRSRPVLSARTAALLREVASNCEEEALRAAFLRLSSRG